MESRRGDTLYSRILNAADDKGHIDTVKARALLGYSQQRWLKLTQCEGFRKPKRDGRVYPLKAIELVGFLKLRAKVEAGITVTQWARMTHHARKYILAQVRRRHAPQAIGYVRGVPRFDRDECVTWYDHDRRGEVRHYPARIGPPVTPYGTPCETTEQAKKNKLVRGGT